MKESKTKKTCLIYKIIVMITMAAICMTLVSCKSDETNVYSPQDEHNDEMEYLPIRVTGSLHDSLALEYGAKTSHGYYEIIDWPDFMLPADHGFTRYGNIVYTDYATCQKNYLCNIPGCAHNTPDCTSFVQYSFGAVLFTDYSESHLYLLSLGFHEKEMKPEDVGTVTEMNMDGTSRRVVCTLSSNESFTYGAVQIASDEYF